jgi:hypothetical protein
MSPSRLKTFGGPSQNYHTYISKPSPPFPSLPIIPPPSPPSLPYLLAIIPYNPSSTEFYIIVERWTLSTFK